MAKYTINERCTGCGGCVSRCPMHCIDNKKPPYIIDEKLCNDCGRCYDNCPLFAVTVSEENGD